MVARPWSSSSLFCGERLLLRCDGNARNSFPTTQGKDQFFRAIRWKRGSSSCGRDSSASSRVETGMLGNFLSCSKGPYVLRNVLNPARLGLRNSSNALGISKCRLHHKHCFFFKCLSMKFRRTSALPYSLLRR